MSSASASKRQSERISARDAKRHCPESRVKKQSARDAWFDKTEETIAALWEYCIQELDKVAPCREESKGSFNCFAQVLADELAPGVIKIVDDSDSEEDPCEDVPDDEVTDDGDGLAESEAESEEETEESELPSDALESDDDEEAESIESTDGEDEEVDDDDEDDDSGESDGEADGESQLE
jgi:hypothetical protein